MSLDVIGERFLVNHECFDGRILQFDSRARPDFAVHGTEWILFSLQHVVLSDDRAGSEYIQGFVIEPTVCNLDVHLATLDDVEAVAFGSHFE